MNDNTKTTSILLYQAPKKRVHLLRSDLKLRVRVLEAMEVLPWASKRHIQLWIRGEAPKRDSGIEGVLKQLVADGKLKTTTIEEGRPTLAYTRRRRINEEEVPHLLGNSECMVRIKLSGGDPISERDFRGFGVVPEGAFGYQLKGTLLLLEFSTKRDWKKTRRLTRKIIAYRKHLSKIRQAYGLIPFVVFIADVERELVARLAEELSASAQEEDQFYFTDYETFKKVEMGQARNAEIYYFVDGKEYSLC